VDDDDLMALALAEAATAAAEGEVPVGAVVVAGGQVIGRGRNRVSGLPDPTAHAEILALGAAAQARGDWRLTGCTLYVTLEPCPMCMGACLNSRLDRIVFGAYEPKFGACGSVLDLRAPPGYNHTLTVTGGVGAGASADLLRSFFRERRQRS
jgi:tRNA(adenine34) deaminase